MYNNQGIFEIILQNSIVILKNTVKNKKKQEENDIHVIKYLYITHENKNIY